MSSDSSDLSDLDDDDLLLELQQKRLKEVKTVGGSPTRYVGGLIIYMNIFSILITLDDLLNFFRSIASISNEPVRNISRENAEQAQIRLQKVSQQYEQYSYPPRVPSDEKDQGLCFVGLSNLIHLNHCGFQGRLRLPGLAAHSHSPTQVRSPPPLQVLVAGCGTGDALVLLCAQLRCVPGLRFRVVGVDPSANSLAICRRRCEVLDSPPYPHLLIYPTRI